MANKPKNFLIALLFVLFGVVTVTSGGKALFTEAGISARGNIVPLVLWFNFLAGFFYVLAGVLTFKRNTTVIKLSTLLALLNIFVLVYLFIHIYQGGLFENRTLYAMSFRTLFWVVFAVYFLKSNHFKKMSET